MSMLALLLFALAQDVPPVAKPASLDDLVLAAANPSTVQWIVSPSDVFQDSTKELDALEERLAGLEASVERCGRLLALRRSQMTVVGSDLWDDACFVPLYGIESFAGNERWIITVLSITRGAPEEFLSELATKVTRSTRVGTRRLGKTRVIAVFGPAREVRLLAPWLRKWQVIEKPPRAGGCGTGAGDPVELSFDRPEGVTLREFVAQAGALGIKIRLEPETLGDLHLRSVGSLRLGRAELRELVEDVAHALLLRVIDDAPGLLFTTDPRERRDRDMVANDLASWRDRRMQCRVDCVTTRIDATEAAAFLQGFVGDPPWEGAAAPESDRIVLSGPAHLVARNLELLRACDQP